MNLVQIQTVALGKEKTDNAGKKIPGRQFGKDAEGNVFFPASGVTLVEGHFANIKTVKVQVKNAEGAWVDKGDDSTIDQAVATWETEDAAIMASLAKRLTKVRTEAKFASETVNLIKELTPERQKALMEAEW